MNLVDTYFTYPYSSRMGIFISKTFQGSILGGTGFVLTEAEVSRLVKRNRKNQKIIFPYLTGKDLNSTIDQTSERYVINFFDWPEEEAKCLRGPRSQHSR